jgi:AsmA protein
LDLETEELDVFIAPRPKRASLVSLANPVEIKGTLSQPEVSVTRLPRRRWLGRGAGIAASLINPAFLILVLSDTGTGVANPCVSAVERAHEIAEVDPR